MDVLQLIWLDFPELQKVIRTHQLPFRLALSPLALTSWLLVLRKIGVNLNEFPHALGEIYDCLPCSVATFDDGGPPMIGDSDWIHSTCDASDCGLGDDCNCYPKCGSTPPARIFDVDSDFDPAHFVCLEEFEERFSSLSDLDLEFPLADNDLPIRYVPDFHGRVMAKMATKDGISTHESGMDSDNDGSQDCISLLEYLRSNGESTNTGTTPTFPIFSDVTTEDQASEISSLDFDHDTSVEVAWKRRPNIP